MADRSNGRERFRYMVGTPDQRGKQLGELCLNLAINGHKILTANRIRSIDFVETGNRIAAGATPVSGADIFRPGKAARFRPKYSIEINFTIHIKDSRLAGVAIAWRGAFNVAESALVDVC